MDMAAYILDETFITKIKTRFSLIKADREPGLNALFAFKSDRLLHLILQLGDKPLFELL